MSIKAILFDLDGTLIDTAPDFIISLNLLLADKGKSPLPETLIRNNVSNGATALVQLGFPEVSVETETFKELRQYFLKIYSHHLADLSKPFDGINELIEFSTRHHCGWGIVTNKPWIYTEPLLKKMIFPSEPMSVICPEHVKRTKPDPEPLLLACKQIGCETSEAIYLGDHRRDIESAHHANMRSIACDYGYIEAHDKVYDWGAHHTISHPLEAVDIIKSYF